MSVDVDFQDVRVRPGFCLVTNSMSGLGTSVIMFDSEVWCGGVSGIFFQSAMMPSDAFPWNDGNVVGMSEKWGNHHQSSSLWSPNNEQNGRFQLPNACK